MAETQNIVIEPMGGVPIQGHSIVSISNDTPIYMALKDENGVGTYELHSGITTFAIQSGSSVAIYNDSDENIEISYTLLDVAKSVTLPEDYFIPDEYKLVIFAQGIMGIQVAAEDIEAVTYQTVKNYYMREQDELNKRFETLELIVEGRTTGYVFDTETDMNTWLEDAENLSRLKMGDNLYIRALDVPDYWWDGTTAQPLETQKVDLSEYYTKKQVDTYFVPSTRTVAGIGLYSNIMPSTLAQVISLEMASAIAGNSSGINIIAYGLSGYTSAFAAQIASNMSFCNTFGNMLGMAFGSNTQYVAAASNIAKSSAFGDAFGSYLASYIASNSAYSLALSYIGNHSWFFEALKKTLTEKSYVLVPKPNSADAGKILTITSTGGLSWITP